MSAYYSVAVAYGIAATYDGELPSPLNEMDDPYDGSVDAWLAEQGCPDLRFGGIGNQWSGPRRWEVYVEGTRTELFASHEEVKVLAELDTVKAVARIRVAYDQLIRAGRLLGIEPIPSWLGLVDVC